jgi:hypothetical protein
VKDQPQKALDEEYLGQRLPGAPWLRNLLLKDLEEWLDDPEKGPKWVWENRRRLLTEATIVAEERVVLLRDHLKS